MTQLHRKPKAFSSALLLSIAALATLALSGCIVVTTDYHWREVPLPRLAPAQAAPPAAAQPARNLAQEFAALGIDLVYFDFDQSVLTAQARTTLDQQVEWLSRYPDVGVRVEGNTDERGSNAYNVALGERRAEAVRAYLIGHGIAAARFNTVSYGEERLLVQPGAADRNRNVRTVVISTGSQ